VGSDGSAISVSGGFGSIKFATASSDNDMIGVASGLVYSGNNALNATTVDAGSSTQVGLLEYTLPKAIDGLTAVVRLQNGTTANAVNLTNEDAQWRFTYAAGPLTATYNTTGGTSPGSDMSVTYDAGIATFKYAADTKRTGKGKRTGMSVSIPMGAMTLAASSESQKAFSSTVLKASASEFNVSYALSKRTTVNAAWGSFKNVSGAERTANTVKVVHTF
jgi:hypothetical protein